jgi:hypothetical protein
MTETSVTPPRAEYRLTGSFDLAAARTLCDALIAGGRREVLVDVTRVRDVHDDALALLSRAMHVLRGRVALRGLNRHQLRVLRYLGAPLRSLEGVSF